MKEFGAGRNDLPTPGTAEIPFYTVARLALSPICILSSQFMKQLDLAEEKKNLILGKTQRTF